jgi:hypothetical protein
MLKSEKYFMDKVEISKGYFLSSMNDFWPDDCCSHNSRRIRQFICPATLIWYVWFESQGRGCGEKLSRRSFGIKKHGNPLATGRANRR